MTENKDDGGWANDVDNEEFSSDGKSCQSNELNTNQITAPKPLSSPMSSCSSGRSSKASKSKTSSTHRENQRLLLEIERMRTALSKSARKNLDNATALPALRHSQTSLQNSDSSHSSSTRSNGSISVRRENERLRLENEQIRLELKELQQNFAILQTTLAAPVPEVIEVEVLRPDREEYLKSRIATLTNLVQRIAIECQDLQVENRMLRLQMTGDESEGISHAGTAIVKPSLWEKYCNKLLMGGAILVVAGAVTYSYWPVSCAGRNLRIAKAIFQNGMATDCIMEMISKKTPEQKTVDTCPIEELIIDILRVSQGGVGLAELGW